MEWCRLGELVDLFCNHMKRPVGPKAFILSGLAHKSWRLWRIFVGGVKHVHNWQSEGLSCSYCILPTKTVPQTLMGLAGGATNSRKQLCMLHYDQPNCNITFPQKRKKHTTMHTTFACSIPVLLCKYSSQGDVQLCPSFGSGRFQSRSGMQIQRPGVNTGGD